MNNETEHGPLEGNLQIWSIEEDGRQKIMIYADPVGLESFGKILIAMSKVNQENFKGMPDGERDHFHIYPEHHLSKGSLETLIGRLEAKGTGEFPASFVGERR